LDGYISLVSGNHDLPRLRISLSPEEIALAFAFIFTMPGVPFLYYGDEIGMRYLNLASKEGGYHRTGARTPMQWNRGENLGFSCADPSSLYLPVDPAPDAPTVDDAEKNPSSLLNTLKAILRLRHAEKDLQARPNLEIVYAEKSKLPFVYRRGSLLLALNPGGKAVDAAIGGGIETAGLLYALGNCAFERGLVQMAAQSFGIWRIN
jgi:maltose alpha-D-glucosyltransferase/alpha-amylase